MYNRHVQWVTVVGLKNGKQLQVAVEIDLEEFARNFAVKAEESKSKALHPCGGSATVKIQGYPTRG